MDISVLMSVYYKERPENLNKAIDSIINQTYMPKQIVIIKDGRLTKELDVIINKYKSEFPKLIDVYELKENQGLGCALNFGMEKCKYDYIARMDSDDISREDRFEKQVKYLKENCNIDILGGYIQEYNYNMTKKIAIRKVPKNTESIYKEMKRQCPFNHSTVIYKKSSVQAAGKYKNCKMEDYHLWIKMYVKNMEMANLEDILVDYRTSYETYKRRTGINYIKEMVKIEKELLDNDIINKLQYIKNILCRGLIAFLPAKIKMLIYPKIIRKL